MSFRCLWAVEKRIKSISSRFDDLTIVCSAASFVGKWEKNSDDVIDMRSAAAAAVAAYGSPLIREPRIIRCRPLAASPPAVRIVDESHRLRARISVVLRTNHRTIDSSKKVWCLSVIEKVVEPVCCHNTLHDWTFWMILCTYIRVATRFPSWVTGWPGGKFSLFFPCPLCCWNA